MARLAESPTQQGWDVEIVNQDGTRDEALQLKATESMSYVKTALDENPDIRVVVPSELEDEAADSAQLISTDISNASLKNEVGDQLGELSESGLENALDEAGELAFDSIPGISLLIIGATEGRKVLTGRCYCRGGCEEWPRACGEGVSLLDHCGSHQRYSGGTHLSTNDRGIENRRGQDEPPC